LEGYPRQVVEQFEFLLKAGQLGVVLSEGHGFGIDFNAMARVRRVVVEVGKRLAQGGSITAAEDVFHLGLDKLRAELEQPGDGRVPHVGHGLRAAAGQPSDPDLRQALRRPAPGHRGSGGA